MNHLHAGHFTYGQIALPVRNEEIQRVFRLARPREHWVRHPVSKRRQDEESV